MSKNEQPDQKPRLKRKIFAALVIFLTVSYGLRIASAGNWGEKESIQNHDPQMES